MIDHTGVTVSDFEKSKAFHRAALEPIGYQMLMVYPAPVTGMRTWLDSACRPKRISGSTAARQTNRPCTWPFAYKAELWSARSTLQLWPPADDRMASLDLVLQYHLDYYGAFVLDPDGHNIEVVCHEPP